MLEKNRIESPSINNGGLFNNVTFDEAINYTSGKIKEIIAQYGPDSVAVLASPKMSNEELYLLQKFSRLGLKNNNISSFSYILNGEEKHCLDDYYGATVSTTTINDIKNTDVIVVMNTDLQEESLIMELKIKAARKKGSKLVVISSSETSLSKIADLWVDLRKGTNTVLLSGLIKEIASVGNSFDKLKDSVSRFNSATVSAQTGVDEGKYLNLVEIVKDNSTNIVFVYNIDSLKEKSRNDLSAINNFMAMTGRTNKESNGILILREFSNSTGLFDMGVTPHHLPGYVKLDELNEIGRIEKLWNTKLTNVFKPVDLSNDLQSGKIKAVLIFGENPLSNSENEKYFRNVEFMMVMDAFNSETASAASVVIPAITSIEQSGTYTSCDTKIQKVQPVIGKRNNLENWEIISKLANQFSDGFEYNNSENIFEEIKKVNRIYSNCSENDYWNENQGNKRFFIDQKKIDFIKYDVVMATFLPVMNHIHFSDKYFLNQIKNRLIPFPKKYE